MGCAQVRPPDPPAHPYPGWPLRMRKWGQGRIGAGLRIWGCPRVLPAPPHDPATDPTPRFAPYARRPDLVSGPEALSHTKGATLPGAPWPQLSLCPHNTSHPHCKTAASHPPAPLPVTQAQAHWRPFAGPSGRVKSRPFFSRAACCADDPARRHVFSGAGAARSGADGSIFCCALAWWPGAIFRIKWAPPHGRGAVCTLVCVKNRLE